MRNLLKPLARKAGSLAAVEQAAIEGILDPASLEDARDGGAEPRAPPRHSCRCGRARLARNVDKRGLVVARTVHGVTEERLLDATLLRSAEARRLHERAAELRETYGAPGSLVTKDKARPVNGPCGLLDAVMELGPKSGDVQRYKGLGEINPEQLWETTLNPDARTLLQVRVPHADLAEETFSTLMGDLVEPRRDFIQQNALDVVNLDV